MAKSLSLYYVTLRYVTFFAMGQCATCLENRINVLNWGVRGSKPIVKNMSFLFSLNLRNFLIDIFQYFSVFNEIKGKLMLS